MARFRVNPAERFFSGLFCALSKHRRLGDGVCWAVAGYEWISLHKLHSESGSSYLSPTILGNCAGLLRCVRHSWAKRLGYLSLLHSLAHTFVEMKPYKPSVYTTPDSPLPGARGQVQGPSVLHEGWILKKRRKKMQGFFSHALLRCLVDNCL